VHPDLPNLFFVGFFDATGGSNIRMMDEQSEYVAAIASGAIALPDKAALQRAIREDLEFQKSQFPDSPRYGLELDPVRYRKRLAADYKRSGVFRKAPRPVKPVPAGVGTEAEA
jgi:dimethylaniline monooxygenase (N-oxide forming)